MTHIISFALQHEEEKKYGLLRQHGFGLTRENRLFCLILNMFQVSQRSSKSDDVLVIAFRVKYKNLSKICFSNLIEYSGIDNRKAMMFLKL